MSVRVIYSPVRRWLLRVNRATLDDRAVLSALSASLEQNQREWSERAQQAKLELQAAEDSFRWVSPGGGGHSCNQLVMSDAFSLCDQCLAVSRMSSVLLICPRDRLACMAGRLCRSCRGRCRTSCGSWTTQQRAERERPPLWRPSTGSLACVAPLDSACHYHADRRRLVSDG